MISSFLPEILPELSMVTVGIALLALTVISYFVYSRFFKASPPSVSVVEIPTQDDTTEKTPPYTNEEFIDSSESPPQESNDEQTPENTLA
jgi:hypothetical protein